ncbi:unnamed protein product [Ceutorhynchus assimilis]|uniref:Uncharacterized protein n=1 Tax=Ceutorhynchus assimilis TaxID=467358 RepID=A0A9N9QI73_9CUCU|nr:unnamed protein product [Ceutorhynchus assimilis]
MLVGNKICEFLPMVIGYRIYAMAEKEQEPKLLSLFQEGATAGPLKRDDNEKGEKRSCDSDELETHPKRLKASAPDQMCLDAGQKRFELVKCRECNRCYYQGHPEDEFEHSNLHYEMQVVQFNGWTNERVVADYLSNGRIIQILPTDSRVWLRKAEEVMFVVNRNHGGVLHDISNSQMYIYIKNSTIAGCVVAKTLQQPMLDNHIDVSPFSGEHYPTKCGISHVWVGASFTNQGIAYALVEAVKSSYFPDCVLSDNDVGITAPTVAGAAN